MTKGMIKRGSGSAYTKLIRKRRAKQIRAEDDRYQCHFLPELRCLSECTGKLKKRIGVSKCGRAAEDNTPVEPITIKSHGRRLDRSLKP